MSLPSQVYLKVCGAADKGQAVNPETIKAMDSEEVEEGSDNGKEWKHDFDNNGKMFVVFIYVTFCKLSSYLNINSDESFRLILLALWSVLSK